LAARGMGLTGGEAKVAEGQATSAARSAA